MPSPLWRLLLNELPPGSFQGLKHCAAQAVGLVLELHPTSALTGFLPHLDSGLWPHFCLQAAGTELLYLQRCAQKLHHHTAEMLRVLSRSLSSDPVGDRVTTAVALKPRAFHQGGDGQGGSALAKKPRGCTDSEWCRPGVMTHGEAAGRTEAGEAPVGRESGQLSGLPFISTTELPALASWSQRWASRARWGHQSRSPKPGSRVYCGMPPAPVASAPQNSTQPFGACTPPALWDLVESSRHPLWNCEGSVRGPCCAMRWRCPRAPMGNAVDRASRKWCS